LKDHFADLIPSVNICEKVSWANEESIVEEAKKHAADLIVTSSHGRTPGLYRQGQRDRKTLHDPTREVMCLHVLAAPESSTINRRT